MVEGFLPDFLSLLGKESGSNSQCHGMNVTMKHGTESWFLTLSSIEKAGTERNI
jgi:hypothetical protein